MIDGRRPRPELEPGEGARWSGVRTGHETNDGPVRIRYIHRDSELAPVVDVAVRDVQLDAPSDHRHHLLGRVDHEGADIEPIQHWSARAVLALTKANHETCSVVGKHNPPDRR